MLILHNMVDGDITKIDQILDKGVLEILNWLSLIKEKGYYENK